MDYTDIRHVPRDGGPATDIVLAPFHDHAYISAVVYVPGTGLFIGGPGLCGGSDRSGGLVAYQDKRRFSKLRQAWCAAVVRGVFWRGY